MTPEERRDGIGASDAGALLNLPPGCRRRLWYEKTGVAPDVIDTRLEHLFRRGHKLEPLVIREYSQQTGRIVWTPKAGQQKCIHPEVAFFYCHKDATIPKHYHGRSAGVLECKTMGQFPFRQAKRDGLLEAYICQLQWALMVMEWDWGAYAILWPDAWELVAWDVMADKELQKTLRQEGENFWRQVENGPSPERLGHEDTRCKRCAWRYTCWETKPEDDPHGEKAPPLEASETLQVDETLSPLLYDLRDAQEIQADAEETVEAIKNTLRGRLGDRTAVSCSGFRVYYREPKAGLRVDSDKLRREYPRIWELCSQPGKTSRVLRVYDGPGT